MVLCIGDINLGIILKCNEYTNKERDMVLHLKRCNTDFKVRYSNKSMM